MIRMFLMTVSLLTVFSFSALAETNTGTTPAHQVAGKHKPLKDMTPEERRAFWDNLPEADKQRILERRKQLQITREGGSDETTGKTKTRRFEDMSSKRQESAKEKWESMTPAEKKLFLQTHSAEIRDAVNARARQ